MSRLSSSQQGFAMAWMAIGISLGTIARSLHGVLFGAAVGAGLAMILTAAYILGAGLRKHDTGWLPSRDRDDSR
ncbi:MAG: hypothetical protein FWE71_15285 [Nocardioidaceae bacterium]|nr:hypothetical protein [Nocardioidaceae bacterium]MCL2614543.1 hypothetical protein [Nocardioidaceae bacterium]